MLQSTASTALDASGTVSLVCRLCPHWSEQTSVCPHLPRDSRTTAGLRRGWRYFQNVLGFHTHLFCLMSGRRFFYFLNFFLSISYHYVAWPDVIFGQVPSLAGEGRLLASQPAHPIHSRFDACGGQ